MTGEWRGELGRGLPFPKRSACAGAAAHAGRYLDRCRHAGWIVATWAAPLQGGAPWTL